MKSFLKCPTHIQYQLNITVSGVFVYLRGEPTKPKPIQFLFDHFIFLLHIRIHLF